MADAVLGFALLLLLAVSAGLGTTVGASAETRSLKLYYIHTKEKAEIVFKRNGRYDQAGLTKLNRFLRDWRRNEPTKMDPRLFDLVWEVYRQTGARDYIHVVSAYRSPATNAMLRRTRGGQATKSQHMTGKAMDFFIPGVKLDKLRAVSMKLQGGGVGYYPKSGSPFVHLDVASVRAWPRMSRQELSRLFPDGKTLHLPPDGKPLPGYQVALAEYKRRGGTIVSAGGGDSDAGSSSGRRSGGLLAALFGGDEDEEPEAIAAAPTPVPAPPQTELAALPGVPGATAPAVPTLAPAVAALPIRAPIPVARPVVEQPVVVAALAPPAPVIPAQADIEAFAAAANAEVATEPPPAPPAIVDLAGIRAPIPVLLGERAARPEPAAVEVAALPVPVPVQDRMIVTASAAPQTASAAAAASQITEAQSSGPAEMLTALPAGEEFVPLPIRRPGSRPGDRLIAAPPQAIEVASLKPAPVARGNRLVDASAASSAPRKGDRPTAVAAKQPQRTAVRTEPRLTETMISRWALAQDRLKTTPVLAEKARRFVVSQLRAAPTMVYANGFALGGEDLPHGQFSGSAVNFIAVARFDN